MRRLACRGAVLAASFVLVAALAGCASAGQASSSGTSDSQTAPRESAIATSEGQGAPQSEGQGASQPASTENAASTDIVKEESEMKLSIDGADVAVEWEDNQAVADLRALASNGPIVVELHMYGGFEQVGPLGARLTTSDEQMTTQSGDIVLYAGDQISIFYGPNSWAYTKLGHISGKTPEEMTDLLGNGNVSISITIG